MKIETKEYDAKVAKLSDGVTLLMLLVDGEEKFFTTFDHDPAMEMRAMVGEIDAYSFGDWNVVLLDDVLARTTWTEKEKVEYMQTLRSRFLNR
jgi:hypothetical protein